MHGATAGGRRERARCAWQVILCLCAVLMVTGCRESAAPVVDNGPVLLFEQMRDVHQSRRYTELEPLVDAKRLPTLLRTLMAVDRLLTVSAQLADTAARRLGPTAGQVCDLSVLADYLGPFSRRARALSTRIDGDEATVVYQVGERIPIERVQMHRLAGRWIYVPDAADERLPDLLNQLTDHLVALKAEAQQGTFDERAFIDEYVRRVQQPLATHLEQEEQSRKAQAE